jgi:hypothetical protein
MIDIRVFISLETIPSAHKTQVEFRPHFSEGKKVRLLGWEIWYIIFPEVNYWPVKVTKIITTIIIDIK